MSINCFSMKIAGHVAQVESRFASTQAYFRDYLTEEVPAFTIAPTDRDLEFEQSFSIAEAIAEGIRPRTYNGAHLERAAIQRAFAEFLFDRDILLLHGSTVAVGDQAFLFTAKCGTGKSTHTRLWCQAHGGRMVNDDKPFLKLRDAGVTAFGSPWNGKHGLSENIAVALQGICLLQRGEENRIWPIAPADALPMLRQQVFQPQDPAKLLRLEMLLQKLTRTVPLWAMECNKDIQAAHVAYQAMSRGVFMCQPSSSPEEIHGGKGLDFAYVNENQTAED